MLEVLAATTPATVQIVFRGQEELDALSDSVATRRMALGRSHICATPNASSAA